MLRSRVNSWVVAALFAGGACAAKEHFPLEIQVDPRSDGAAAPSDAGSNHAAAGATNSSKLVAGGDALLHCPELTLCQAEPLGFQSGLLITASDVGPEVRFVALAGSAILAERGEAGEPIAVFVTTTSLPAAFEVQEFAATRLTHPKAVAITHDYDRTYGLLCDDQACEVFGLAPNQEPRTVAARSAMDGALTGIVTPCSSAGDEFCVFGDGLFCFDGSAWTTEIEPASVPRIRAVAMDEATDVAADGSTIHCRPMLAAGDEGTLLRYEDDAWKAIDIGVGVDLTTVTSHTGRFTAAGEGVLIEGDPFGWISCPLDGVVPHKLIRLQADYNCSKVDPQGQGWIIDEDAAARGFDTDLYGFTATGRLVIGSGGCSGSEQWQCDAASGPAVDFDVRTCGIARNPWLLTADALTGSVSCPID